MQVARFDKLSGSTKLFLDFISCGGTSCEYYKYDFRELSSYKTVAEKIDSISYNRDALVSVLRKSLGKMEISRALEENLEKLARPDSLVVFAGQQVGVLLGPMYTVIKALTAYKLAAKLEAELGRPVVPCFWMATDDHDFDEVKTAKFLNRAGDCAGVSYEPDKEPEGLPMADIILDSHITEFISKVQDSLIETEFTPDIKSRLESSYREGMSLAESFGFLFNDLLGDFGIVPVDPNFDGMKDLMVSVFQKEIENHEEIFEIFEKRSLEIMEAGYHRQVHKTSDNLNLFMVEDGRRNIVVENGGYHLDGKNKSYSRGDLLDLLKSDPSIFSPNVCLRPIAQCAALPTVCQITGPSEAAYFAQIGPLFEYMNIPFPVIRPRMFATLLEPQVKRSIEKLSIDFSQLYNDTEKETGRVITENFPPEIQNRAESLRPEVLKPLDNLAGSLKQTEPEGFQAIEHTRKRMDQELNHLSKKLLTIHKKRHDKVREQVYKAFNFLFPEGKFQERVLSPVYFADKFGPDIFRKIEPNLDIDSVDHQIVDL